MTDARLTNLQFSALAALWTQPSSGVSNTFIQKNLHVDLTKAWDGLRSAKLIEMVQKKKGARIEAIRLTPEGRRRLREEAALEPIGRPGTGDRVLRAPVHALRDRIDDSRNLPELLTLLDGAAPTVPAETHSHTASTAVDLEDLQIQIRK